MLTNVTWISGSLALEEDLVAVTTLASSISAGEMTRQMEKS